MSIEVATLMGTALGAIIGLVGPVIATAIGRKDIERATDREVAATIMDLFADGRTIGDVLSPQESTERRRLYLLALRLRNSKAREACLKLVANSTDANKGEDALEEAWYVMTQEVGRIYRGTNRT
jgi:hypothetical protein